MRIGPPASVRDVLIAGGRSLTAVCACAALQCGGAVASSQSRDAGPHGDTSSSSGSSSGGFVRSDDSGSGGGIGSDGSLSSSDAGRPGSSSGGSFDAGEYDVDLTPGCWAGQTTCDLCLSQYCCSQVVECKRAALCQRSLECLISCERAGSNGLACAAGECNQADQYVTALFTCGSQLCSFLCGMN